MTPLGFVLFITILKESIEDFMRFRRDSEINNQKYKVLTSSSQYTIKKSKDLSVGDIIEIQQNTRVPADLVLLYTNSPTDSVFIRTDQLDGETDWKLRFPISFLQKSIKGTSLYKNLHSFPGYIETGNPNELIYEFAGAFVNESAGVKEAITLENCLWANTVLATGKVIGMVIFTGRETKIQKSVRKPIVKLGRIDREINVLSIFLFILMVLISLIIVLLSGMKFNLLFIAIFFRFVLLLSSIIPISMKVNLEIAKLVYCYKIAKDSDIKGTIARNMNIPEELGRVHYILTDKTGTLTRNEMIFRKLQLSHKLFNLPENSQELKKSLEKGFNYSEDSFLETEGVKSEFSLENLQSQTTAKSMESSMRKTHKNLAVKEAILAMALCHNVTPINEEPGEETIEKKNEDLKKNEIFQQEKNNEVFLMEKNNDNLENFQLFEKKPPKSYQASSPDEIALVKTADELGLSVSFRDQKSMILTRPNGKDDVYKILRIFPFSSESKRMGILVRNLDSKKINFYVKGADTVINKMLSPQQSSFILEQCDDLAREGLRTLVFAGKLLSEHEYEVFANEYNTANANILNREENLKKAIEKIERNLDFISITGVEDLLQENVAASIDSFRQADIKVWMITGDKVATAICIAISAGLYKPKSSELYVMKELTTEEEVTEKINDLSIKSLQSVVLVIDGGTLQEINKNERLKSRFFKLATKVANVICCRCSPQEKSFLTQTVKKLTRKVVLSIGDGGNDVGMIQIADIGVGIVGKEGKQAALAADFSIEKFEYLNKLLFWHGRLSYKRSAVLSQFIIHRGLIISFLQAIFSLVFYFVAISIFNGTLLLGYSTIYTVLPVFCLVLDEDLNVETALSYPDLYRTLKRSRDLNYKSFLIWVFKSLYQAIIIMWLSLYVFDKAFLKIVTITFTCLILTEFFNIYTVLNRIHVLMIVSQVLSVIIYFLSIMCLRIVMDVSDLTWDFLGKIVLITAISFLPLYIANVIRKHVAPNDFEKVMRNVNVGRINTSLGN